MILVTEGSGICGSSLYYLCCISENLRLFYSKKYILKKAIVPVTPRVAWMEEAHVSCPESPGARTPRPWGGSPSGGLSYLCSFTLYPPSPDSRVGSPQMLDWLLRPSPSSQARPWVFLVSGFLQTQDRGWRAVSTLDPVIFLGPRLCLGCSNWELPPAATWAAREGLACSHCLLLHLSLSSHPITGFFFFSIGNLISEGHTAICVSFPTPGAPLEILPT